MDSKKNIKSAIIGFAVVISLVAALYFIFSMLNNDELEYESYLKNYKVNEYIPVYISDEAMARIYFNEYINMMFSDINKAYNLLDSDYRSAKFGSIDNFILYVDSIRNNTFTLSKYYKTSIRGYSIFGTYDTNENMFIFKTNGVMQYSVYLDDYTVEIR